MLKIMPRRYEAPQFSDDIYLGPAAAPNMEWAQAQGNTSQLNPAPMGVGVGPVGRLYVFDVVPTTISGNCLVASGNFSSGSNLTLRALANSPISSTTNAQGSTIYKTDTPRNITFNSPQDISAATFSITGTDLYGQTVTENVTGGNATLAEGNKAFASVSRIAVSGANVTNTTVGVGDKLGLPVAVPDAGYVVHVGWANTLARDAGTLATANASTANATTGDVRGTYKPSSASNSSRRLVMAIALRGLAVGPNATRAGAFGVDQA